MALRAVHFAFAMISFHCLIPPLLIVSVADGQAAPPPDDVVMELVQSATILKLPSSRIDGVADTSVVPVAKSIEWCVQKQTDV